MDIAAGRKATEDSYVYVPDAAMTTRTIPAGQMKMLRFDTGATTFTGILSADDFVPDPNGAPFAFEPRSAGVYHFSMFIGFQGDGSTALDLTNSYDVLIARDTNQQADYQIIGRGFVPGSGGFCNVTAYSYLGPSKESSVHFRVVLNRGQGAAGTVIPGYFLLRISKIS